MHYLKPIYTSGVLGGMVLALLLWTGVMGYGQLALNEVALDGQTVEPSGGASQVVFEFNLSDIDPLSNDSSDVTVQCILIQNLGTATAMDIPSLQLQGPSVQTPSDVFTAPPPIVAPANCPSGAAGGSNVAFEVFIDQATLTTMGFASIDDGGSINLQIAVKAAATNTLLSGSQNHTLKLRVALQFQETVGSPGVLTTFTDSITDSNEDRVSNSGINELRAVNFLNNTIRIGETGIAASFRVCDDDANTLGITLNTVRVVQRAQGDALDSDISMLIVKMVGGGEAPLPPNSNFNPGGVGFSIPVGFTVDDDKCEVFQISATVAGTAQRGRKLHLSITLFVSEGGTIDSSVAPTLQTPETVLIGSGILSVPDSYIAGSSIPLTLGEFPLPGLGRLDVQTQPIQFDPSVISVDSIEPESPYQLSDFSVDNRAGLLRFTLKVNPAQTSSAKTQGAIALINVSRRGQAGESTLLLLQVDRVLDANDLDVTAGIMVVSGFVTLLAPGDVDFDGAPTVRDALMVANAILPCMELVPQVLGPDDEHGLTDEQKKIADVAFPQASVVPTCTELNSADIREIARLAITVGISGGPGFVAEPAQQAVPPDKPWWQRWLEQVFHPRQEPAAQATLLTTDANEWQLLLDSPRPVAAVQGRIRFDPSLGEVAGVGGLDGYLLAYEVDSRHGVVRFAALLSGERRPRAAILEVRWKGEPSAKPQLELAYVLDQHAGHVPFVITRMPFEDPARLVVAGLRLHAWEVAGGRLEVLGQGVAHTRIEGFDLAGRRRFTAESAGNALRWTMLDGQGRALANGVYLFVVTVRGFSGEVWRSEVRKLVWLR